MGFKSPFFIAATNCFTSSKVFKLQKLKAPNSKNQYVNWDLEFVYWILRLCP